MISSDWCVLVVEDQSDINDLFATLLRHLYQCEVLQAASARDAIKLAQSSSPQLILLDLKLDGGLENGLDVARSIRAEKVLKQPYIVVISNHAWNQEIVQDALSAGCDCCLDKAEFICDFKGFLNSGVTKAMSAHALRLGQ